MRSDDALIMKLLQERRKRIEDVLDGKIKQRPFRGWRRVQLSRVNAEIARRLPLYPSVDGPVVELREAIKALEPPFLALPEHGHTAESLAYQRGARDAYMKVLQVETRQQTELLVEQLQALQDELKALRG